jgi:protein gp37
MGKTSPIEWTDATWNPWYGCRKVSAGCKLCYVERDMERYGREFSKVTRANPATFNAPLKWKAPLRIFTCSWSDFFIEEADPWRAEAWEIIRQTPQHAYMILTKRPNQIIRWDDEEPGPGAFRLPWSGTLEKPWLNVWLGTSAENQNFFDERVNHLFTVSAALWWVSMEPMLGPINTGRTLSFVQGCDAQGEPMEGPRVPFLKEKPSLGWVVIGGESARPRSKARPFHLEWAFDALAQCRAAGVACFIKQLGSNPYYHGKPLRLRHWKGGDMTEWPAELRVRELPTVNCQL